MAMVKTQIPEGYATIRRSKSRAKKLRTASSSSDHQHFEMIELGERNSINRKYDSETLYSNHQNDIYDDAGEVDEGVINDIETDGDGFYRKSDAFCDSKRTFQTFKPRLNGAANGSLNEEEMCVSSKDSLRQSSDCFQSLPYDLLMSPLKSPQYINQLNAMRCGKPNSSMTDAAVRQQQFPLYARPDSPKYGKGLYNRSTSPSADSMDNCSSNSSTYSSAYRQAPSLLSQDDENLIMINVSTDGHRKPPLRATNLSYRKSFSHVNRTHHAQSVEAQNFNRKMNASLLNRSKQYQSDSQEFINYEKPAISTLTMTKSLAMPSMSTSNLYTRQRFATLAHPKEKLQAVNTKSTSSLNENHVFWDPLLECKIGSQSTLRSKPIVPWWELACKKEHRQSCPPMQVTIRNFMSIETVETKTANLHHSDSSKMESQPVSVVVSVSSPKTKNRKIEIWARFMLEDFYRLAFRSHLLLRRGKFQLETLEFIPSSLMFRAKS